MVKRIDCREISSVLFTQTYEGKSKQAKSSSVNSGLNVPIDTGYSVYSRNMRVFDISGEEIGINFDINI